MAITSQIKANLSFGELEIIEWQKAGLLKPSRIKPIFTTIEERIILKTLGSLEVTDENNLRQLLQQILG